jgi:ubiquitin-like-conjugating enzyme ATG10
VEYDIVYSESYQVPTLFFKILDSWGQVQTKLDVVHQYLIASSAWEAIQAVGILGAISTAVSEAARICVLTLGSKCFMWAQNHPITGTPAFFVHPCQTADAMRSLEFSNRGIDYLIAWIGLIGSSVGLHVPVGVAQASMKD